ncbi:MAG: hypothetical protein KF763_06420 [Cyclobacteriaceae bacterium]|nr:hypothetical protein [Cyclobacteriaceae bacterium]
MKSRITIMSLLSVMVVFAASAQETDDMYFRASDRAKIAASKPLSELSYRQSEVKTPINPTDSYSARNVNPEYISQSVSSSNQQPATYFYSEYVPTSVNQNIYNNPANWNYYGMNNPYMMGGMNPYMVGGYNPYFRNSFWGMDPYGFNSFYRPGLSFSMGMGWGMNSWGYSPWNSFYGMNSWAWDPYGYNAFSPWGWNNMGWNGWGWNTWNRPTIIVVGGDSGNGAVYGRRSSRSSSMNNTINSSRGTRQSAAIQNDTRGGSGSRTAVQNTDNYYQRGWRNNPDNTSRTSLNNTGLSTSRTGTTFDNSTRSSNRSSGGWMDSGSSSRSSGSFNSGSSNTRSSGSNFSSGGGSRSTGSSGGSSSSGARGGRNN